jgi:PAS domain S-box-containing protein
MLLAALAVLPFAGLVIYNDVSARSQATEQARNDTLQLVKICSEDEERMVDSADELLATMAEVPVIRRMDPQAAAPVLTRMLSNERTCANLGLLDPAGRIITSARPVALPGPMAARVFFKQAIAHGGFAVSDFEVEPDGHHAEMICGEPVRADDGTLVGVVFAEMTLEWLPNLQSQLALPPGTSIGVVNESGIVVMRIPDAADYVGKSVLQAPAGRLMMSHGGSGTADEVGLDHTRRLFAYTPLDATHNIGAYVSAAIPDDIAFASSRSLERWQFIILGIFAIVVFATAWIAADVLVLRGVRALLRATKTVAAGDLAARAAPMRGSREFQELAQAFDAMAASLERKTSEQMAAAMELERRVEQRTAELEKANTSTQEVAEKLQLTNERLDLALRGTTDGIWDWDLVSGQMYFSPRWKDMLGYEDEEIGDRFREWETRVHPDDRDRALTAIRDYFGRKSPCFELEHRLQHKDGSYRWILSRGVAVWDENGKPKRMAGSHQDLTERRRAEQALRESESKLRAFINNVPAILFAIDRSGVITMAEGLGMEAFRNVKGGVVGHSIAEFHNELAGLIESVRKALTGETAITVMELRGLHYEVACSPIHGPDESITGVIGVAHDISERVRAKEALEASAAELRRSNEELEQFAYIASHDLQEPLRMVASYTQLLERRYAAQLDDAAREFIGFAVDGARRMQEFITGLLQYSRVGTERRVFAEVNLGEVFETAIANLRIAIEESSASVTPRTLPVVRGDPRQLTQLFQNLIGNALKFRKPNQPPVIEVWGKPDGDLWQIAVQDNGIGVDPRFSQRIFTIFQRLHTRDEYEGTGLGLAICKKIVERHGGSIWVDSKEGEGATFSFTLPAADRGDYDNAQGNPAGDNAG